LKILLLNQCFYPDVVSTAQHLTDLAVGLVEHGHDVTVVASDRGYDNPNKRFPKRQVWKGITIIRIPALALGKKSKWRRALNFASFLIACTLKLFFLPKFDLVVTLTSPPLISFLGSMLVKLRGGKMLFWVMDLNPDEAIAAGWLRKDSSTARMLGGLLRYSLVHSEKIVVLDRFMQRRILDKRIFDQKLEIIAPWSHSDAVRYDAPARDSFRSEHDLSNKFVVMYSGNHSPCHPLDTLVDAARHLADHSNIVFCFVGGGSEQTKVQRLAEQYGLKNVLCLPYQPLDKLAGSLSAADLQVVVMGDPFIGIVHPCKVYNILEVEAPLLYIGPSDSHIADLISEMGATRNVCSARHGEAEKITAYILERAQSGYGNRATYELTSTFSKEALLPHMIEIIESISPQVRASDPALAANQIVPQR